MKFTIELNHEQAQRLIDAMKDMFDELDRKIDNLKGRVRSLESLQYNAESIEEVVREVMWKTKTE